MTPIEQIKAQGIEYAALTGDGTPTGKTLTGVGPFIFPGGPLLGAAPRLLNPAINLTEKGLSHVQKFHVGEHALRLNKSVFNAGEDVVGLIRSSTQQPMARQANGNFARTFDVGRNIGIDRATRAQTSTMTVITDAFGDLITAFPGLP
jgi:hypothetical protein